MVGGAGWWIPKSRRDIQADTPCPVFDEDAHRGAEIGVDAKYGKNASWSELTGKYALYAVHAVALRMSNVITRLTTPVTHQREQQACV